MRIVDPAGFCDRQIPVLSTLGRGPKGEKGDTGDTVYPTFADEPWSIDTAYKKLTVVLHEGNSYTAKQNVPVGVDISNTDFWAMTGNYDEQIERYRAEVESLGHRIDTEIESVDHRIDNAIFLANLDIAVFGDSTSRYNTNADGSSGKSTPEMLSEITSCTVHNYGVSGANICPDSFSSNNDAIKSIYWQVFGRNDLQDYDAFVIFGGTNDIQNGNDFYRTTQDVKCVRYCMQRIVQRLQDQSPNAAIVWVSPYAMYSTPSTMRSSNALAAVNAMKCVLHSLGVPIVDMLNACSVSYANVATVMQNSGDSTQRIYVHPFETLRLRSAYAIANAIAGGAPSDALPQGEVIASLATAYDNQSAVTTDFSIGQRCLSFAGYHLLYTLPTNSPVVIANEIAFPRVGGVITVAGFMKTTSGTVLVQIKDSTSDNWVTVGRVRGAYSGATNFAITIDSRVLESVGITPSNNLFLSVGMKGEESTQVIGGFLLNGYFNGDTLCTGYNKTPTDEYVYRDGISYHYVGQRQVTTDGNGVCSGLPDVFGVCKESYTQPVAYQESTQGLRGVALLNLLNRKLYGSDGSLLSNWSGTLFFDLGIRNYWR